MTKLFTASSTEDISKVVNSTNGELRRVVRKNLPQYSQPQGTSIVLPAAEVAELVLASPRGRKNFIKNLIEADLI